MNVVPFRSILGSVLLQFPVQRCLANPQQSSCQQFVAIYLRECIHERLVLQFSNRNDSIVQLWRSCQQLRRGTVDLRGQVAHLNLMCAGKRAGAFQAVFKFAHIAGPVIIQQCLHGVIGKRLFDPAVPAQPLKNVSNEQWNVLSPLA